MSRQKVNSKSEFVKSSSEFFSQFYIEIPYCDSDIYYLHKNLFDAKKLSAVMESEKITLCEINASLGEKAVHSATSSLTKYTITHYIIVQKLINYLLNTDCTENFGLIENFFWKLLITHPPRTEMFEYYWQILFDKFVSLNDKETEDQNLFFCLIESITSCLQVRMNLEEDRDLDEPLLRNKPSTKKITDYVGVDLQLLCMDARKSFNIILNKSSDTNFNQKQMCFNKLPWKEKVERCLIVLNFVYNILETDFMFFFNSKESKLSTNSNRPLISHLIWKNERDFGFVNTEVQKIFTLYKSAIKFDFPNIRIINKLINLIGETIKWSDSVEETKFPFLGTRSMNFARELSVALLETLTEIKSNLEENELVVNFKSPWLRLTLCSQLLTSITRYQCHFELQGVCEILEYIVNAENRPPDGQKVQNKSSFSKKALKQRSSKFSNINGVLKTGKTLLHEACENNDVEKIKTLLTYPELNVNAVDTDGWTPLHLAAYQGKAKSVEELLLFSPTPGGIQMPVNTRAQGPENTTPLMCAANRGYANICKLLLEHSGSILLEDVNEFNQTAWELSNASGVRRVLKYYKKNNVTIQNSYHELNFDLNSKKLVMKICLEMIQAYFSTYNLSKSSKSSEKNALDIKFKLNHMCLETDIKANINKLTNLLPKLEYREEFTTLSYILRTIISLNRTSELINSKNSEKEKK